MLVLDVKYSEKLSCFFFWRQVGGDVKS